MARGGSRRYSQRVIFHRRRRRQRGRVLATRFGLNPNSSSLGVDVTFLLFGAAVVSFITPVMAAFLRLRRPAESHVEPAPSQPDQGA
jgi:hypothetical protein